MRLLHVWDADDAQYAHPCAAYIHSLSFECHIEQNRNDQWELYVHREEERVQAHEACQQFLADPQNPQFVARVSDVLLQQAARERVAGLEDERIKSTIAWDAQQMPYVTYALIVMSIAVTMLTDFGADMGITQYVTYVGVEYIGNQAMWAQSVNFMEAWRFVTPMFLHLGWIHIIFNMMWLKDLGGLIERRHGMWYLMSLVLVSSVFSNSVQYAVSGPHFGGMSGVVYALFGFMWIRGKMFPQRGQALNPHIVMMMVGWFVLCFFMEGVANAAHAGGLGIGCLWGYISALRARK